MELLLGVEPFEQALDELLVLRCEYDLCHAVSLHDSRSGGEAGRRETRLFGVHSLASPRNMLRVGLGAQAGRDTDLTQELEND